jgi:hypothetical protein
VPVRPESRRSAIAGEMDSRSRGERGVRIKNGTSCLDLNMFTQPCAKGDHAQQWFRVSAGNGAVRVVNKPTRFPQCLDSFWTVKPCVKGDSQQIWRFKLVS